MFCTKCGLELDSDDKFCPKCGTKVYSREEKNISIPNDNLENISRIAADGNNNSRSKRKKKKTILCKCLAVMMLLFFFGLAVKWYKLDNTIFYSYTLGTLSGEETDIVFSVDLADKYPEETRVELYSENGFVMEMNDNGEDGDETAGDHIYSCTHAVELSAGESVVFYAKYKSKKTDELVIRGFDEITEESYFHSSEVVKEIISSADEYVDSTTGYVDGANVEKSVYEVCKAAKKMQKSGEVLDVENNGSSALVRTNNGIWYAYQPNVEDVKATGINVDLDIISMHPWQNTGFDYTSYQDAAKYTDEQLENVYYKSENKNDEVTLDLINSLHKDQIILFDTHGGYSLLLGPYITTGQQFKVSNALSEDAIKGRIVIAGSEKITDNRVAFTSNYVKEYIPRLDHSMVYLGACYSFKDFRLVNSFKEKGAEAVLGYTESVSVSYDKKMIRSIMECMSTYYNRFDDYGYIAFALAYARECNGDDDSAYKDKGKPAILQYVGYMDYRFYAKYLVEFEARIHEQEQVQENIPEEEVKKPVEKPDFAVTVYGNYPIYLFTGHGLVAHFEDQGSDEANNAAKIKVKEYANAYVSGEDTVFTDKNMSQIRPVSATKLKIQKLINNSALSYFNEVHWNEGAALRYMIYMYHDYNPDEVIVTQNGVVVRNICKPMEILYTKKTWVEWAKILMFDAK